MPRFLTVYGLGLLLVLELTEDSGDFKNEELNMNSGF